MFRLAPALVSFIAIYSGGAFAQGVPAPEVTATLNYNEDPDEFFSTNADSFFDLLVNNAGNVIKLDLTIIPNQEEGENTNDYLIRKEDGTSYDCSNYGQVDNYRDSFSVSFQHPANYHHPITIFVGDRLNYPFNELICSAENYTNNVAAPVQISGYFVVSAALIPTAFNYILYPYR